MSMSVLLSCLADCPPECQAAGRNRLVDGYSLRDPILERNASATSAGTNWLTLPPA
jgi:hypothetical protein